MGLILLVILMIGLMVVSDCGCVFRVMIVFGVVVLIASVGWMVFIGVICLL